ncbi:hypothetical protein Sinac_1232 [Singulisphaera acidiphila DSM 18658]|uniref:Uncharacterized protein n=1 Tax=Singulisphaera acidiphila (strain ATCC BAA-1392 / DSM 18658 / VKM B-2454 / MOB10) TaxID=886293 RepID=L0DAD6_SINAD|nr:hypothetical protein Sinac_1232 [Singulisphaera acidiphila DSM 18658]
MSAGRLSVAAEAACTTFLETLIVLRYVSGTYLHECVILKLLNPWALKLYDG